MSDEKTPRKPRRKSAVAPVERPGRTRPDRTPRPKAEVDGRKNPVKRLLSPIQIRVLDTMFDPACSTRADVAHAARVTEHTITKWVADHPPFREEYQRRLHYRGDRIGDLFTQALQLALGLHIEILSHPEKYTLDERIKSAKEILNIGKQHVEVLNIQQTHVSMGAAAPPGPVSTIPSVQRLTATGMSESEAHRADAREMLLIVEQMANGAFQVGIDQADPPAGVIEGEVVDAPRKG